MRFSQHFKLKRTQPYLDFVDIRLDTDVRVFVDPSALRASQSLFGHECSSLIQDYFDLLLKRIKDGRHDDAKRMVSSLNERNEFHLGYSRHRSRGHAFGVETAELVWKALTESKASRSGLLKDLEDTALLIEGIGEDMISDAVCNIIRGPLIRYTQDMCEYYGVPLTPDVDSGPVWNPLNERWEQSLVSLPVAGDHGHVVLVPKTFVRHRLTYDGGEYYRYHLMPAMQADEITRRTALVHLLKDGRKRVYKKDLYKKYGAGKLAAVEQTIPRPKVLENYKAQKEKTPRPPLPHEKLAEIEGTKAPDWDQLLADLKALRPGQDDAAKYEEVIERILSALFYPSLAHPKKQHRIHDGQKRIDLTYMNDAHEGFFHWLASHYPSSLVMVECKNYRDDVGNTELDQLSGRFSPGRGQFGILVCRTIEDRDELTKRCLNTARDQRGYIIGLTDDDLETLINETRAGAPGRFQLLRDRFRDLIS
jgi:hypothetical protein